MADQPDKIPSISKTAFACPHCGAFTTQTWYSIFCKKVDENSRVPFILNQSHRERIINDPNYNDEMKQEFIKRVDSFLTGKPFKKNVESTYINNEVSNLNVSICYNCSDITIWVHEKIVYPPTKIDIEANPDLPDHVKSIFEEAREIVNSSPKGAAALLRLCIQYLCVELGESGKNLDKDIASLVSKGLNPIVQQSLDVVRVIGNESVHPGEINLNDDRETALHLFTYVNLIADQMITHPKNVLNTYNKLPETKRKQIEERNVKAIVRKNDKKTDNQ